MKKYGRNNFKRTIVSFAYSADELNKQEIDTIRLLQADKTDDFYNIEMGGNKSPLSEHTKELIRLNHAHLKGKDNPFYGKHLSEESKRKLSEAKKGTPAYNKGIPMSEEQKQKMKKAWEKTGTRVRHHKEILCLETGEKFFSIQEASNKTGLVYGSILGVLSGRRNSLYGKHFVYLEKEDKV